MQRPYTVPLAIALLWVSMVTAALSCGELSRSAGRLPGPWTGGGMLAGVVLVGLVVLAVCYLPDWFPRIIARLMQLAGMAGAFWAAGTLTRALYAVVG